MVESEVAPPRCAPLSAYAARLAAASDPRAVWLREVPFRSMLDVRLAPDQPEALERLDRALGVSFPRTPGTLVQAVDGDVAVWWLGPEWWLVVTAPGLAEETEDALRAALDPAPGSVADVSDWRTTLELGGPLVRELLLTGCALDLHPRAFPPGSCAQTLLARSPITIGWPRPSDGANSDTDGDNGPVFELLVRTSYGPYLADWLLDATTGLRAAYG